MTVAAWPAEQLPDRGEVLVVVPCYNEAARLPVEVFASFLRTSDDVRLLFVNDGSTDDTSRVLRELVARSLGRAGVLDLPKNQGKAEAVRQGLLAAFRQEPHLVGFWDADLATSLETIGEFRDVLRARPGLDWVIGARVKLLGRRIDRNPLRHYLGRVFATAASMMLGFQVYDTQCGAKLFRANALLADALARPFASRWAFDVELIGRYVRLLHGTGVTDADEKIYEYPLLTWVDVRGSKLKSSDFLLAGLDLLAIWRRLRAERSTKRIRESRASQTEASAEL